jgi:hypothetical protein
LLPFPEREKNNKKGKTSWLREETTYVTCSNIERNLFKRKKKKGGEKNMSEE